MYLPAGRQALYIQREWVSGYYLVRVEIISCTVSSGLCSEVSK
jgi:hypothetical protein